MDFSHQAFLRSFRYLIVYMVVALDKSRRRHEVHLLGRRRKACFHREKQEVPRFKCLGIVARAS